MAMSYLLPGVSMPQRLTNSFQVCRSILYPPPLPSQWRCHNDRGNICGRATSQWGDCDLPIFTSSHPWCLFYVAIVNKSQYNLRLLLGSLCLFAWRSGTCLWLREIPVWKYKRLNCFIANYIWKEMILLNFWEEKWWCPLTLWVRKKQA